MFSRLLGSGLPPGVRAKLALDGGERVIAHAGGGGGDYVVATDRALHLPDGSRVGWESVEHAEWKAGVLHVRETVALGERPREHHVRLADPGRLPETVRERITSTIAISQYEQLEKGHGVRIVARRRPATGETVWTVIFDAGLDPHDPALRARAEQVLTRVRHQTGLD